MTTYYVSSSGSNTAPYDTWAKAATHLSTVTGIVAAGDSVYVAHTHSESQAPAAFSVPATLASPVKVICGNTGATPPTASATTAAVTTTAANGTFYFAGVAYYYGITFTYGTGSSNEQMMFGGSGANELVFENCAFVTTGFNSGSYLSTGFNSSGQGRLTFKNTNVTFPSSAHFYLQPYNEFIWEGGTLSASGVSTLFTMNGTDIKKFVVSGVDLSSLLSSATLVDTLGHVRGVFRDCKLPGSWIGSLVGSGSNIPGSRIEMHNCDSGATNYRIWVEDYAGSIKQETTLVRSGGASDGTTGIALKLVSGANCAAKTGVLRSPEIVIWNDTTGASKTATVEILHDSATNLTNNDVWVEVMYLSASGTPLGTWIADDIAGDNSGNLLATAADQTTSAATWTTTGMTNPNKQKLAVTFTPQMKGFIHARVALAKASKTIYVDPLLTVS